MIFGRKRGAFREGLEQKKPLMGHEFTHIPTEQTWCGVGEMEGRVGHMGNLAFPGDKKLAYHSDWKPDLFSGSCGLRCSDNLLYNDPKKVLQPIVYRCAEFLYKGQSAAAMWELCDALLQCTRGQNYPTFQQFTDAITGVMKRDAHRILNSILLRPMEPGMQQFILPQNKSDETLDIVTCTIKENPECMKLSEEGNVDQHQFVIEGLEQDIIATAHLRDGTTAQELLTLPSNFVLKFQKAREYFVRKSPNVTSVEQIMSISMDAGRYDVELGA
jgi:hypothetical protein